MVAATARSTPPEFRRDVLQDAFDDVRVVLDPQQVRHDQQERVGGRTTPHARQRRRDRVEAEVTMLRLVADGAATTHTARRRRALEAGLAALDGDFDRVVRCMRIAGLVNSRRRKLRGVQPTAMGGMRAAHG